LIITGLKGKVTDYTEQVFLLLGHGATWLGVLAFLPLKVKPPLATNHPVMQCHIPEEQISTTPMQKHKNSYTQEKFEKIYFYHSQKTIYISVNIKIRTLLYCTVTNITHFSS
jgi:hypothetical protein